MPRNSLAPGSFTQRRSSIIFTVSPGNATNRLIKNGPRSGVPVWLDHANGVKHEDIPALRVSKLQAHPLDEQVIAEIEVTIYLRPFAIDQACIAECSILVKVFKDMAF